MDLPANLFAAAFPVVLAAIVLASSAAGLAEFQLVEAVAAPEVGQAYPAAHQHSVVLPELLLPRPDSPLEVAPAPPFPRRACSSPSG